MSRNFFSKKKRSIGLFLLLSVLIHLLLFLLIRDGMEYWAARTRPSPPEPVWVALKKLELPVVDMPKPAQEQVPEKPSAESLYNQKVAQETVRPAEAAPPKPAPPSQPETAAAPKREEQKPEVKPQGNKTPDELYTTKPVDELPSAPSQRIPGMPASNQDFGAPPDDYLPNYKIGNRTYLNTLANPQVAYYVELKRKFRLTWNPAPVLRGQATAIARGKIDVVLGVSLNPRGELVDLKVIRSSGLEAYDREGKRTVQASAPFSSPPSNLMGEDGMLHMAWTFVVYI